LISVFTLNEAFHWQTLLRQNLLKLYQNCRCVFTQSGPVAAIGDKQLSA